MSEEETVQGYIHSVETMGALDGPGLRYVVFLQGCPFRCLFCHNPDTWQMLSTSKKSVDSVVSDIVKYKDFFNFSKGGVTLSGGEPLMQPKFVHALLRRLKQEKIHVALDTCGHVDLTDQMKEIIQMADLFLLDIKHLDPETHLKITGKSNAKTLAFLDYLTTQNKPVWIRVVLLPGYSMDSKYIHQLIDFVKKYPTVEKVELLPYHDKAKSKWAELGLDYPLEGVEPPTHAQVQKIADEMQKAGLNILITR